VRVLARGGIALDILLPRGAPAGLLAVGTCATALIRPEYVHLFRPAE